MKKIIAILLILMVGLFVLGGCISSSSQSSGNQEDIGSPEPQQNQEQAGTNEIPQPPALPED